MAIPKLIPHSRAFEIQEDIAAWMTTAAAFEHVSTSYIMLFRNAPRFKDVPFDQRVRSMYSALQEIATAESNAMAGTTATYCSSDYGLMLSTMANVAPKSKLSPSDVPSREGVLIFEEPVTIEASDGLPTLRDVRALSWYIVPGPVDEWFATRLWAEVSRSATANRIPGRTRLFAGGMNISNLDDDTARDYSLTRLLQAHFALLKSPLTVDEPVERNPKISPRTRRSLAVDSIRRVYLRHPEHARYEADEADAAREGRAPVRAHWVRGHWRNQPYPRTGEVKWIWIDGYIKGSPEDGTVTTRKLLVARATPSEVRELVGV